MPLKDKAAYAEYQRAYRVKNRARLTAAKKEYARLHPEQIRNTHRAYRERNKEAANRNQRERRRRNIDWVRLQKRQYERKRRALKRGCEIGLVEYSAIYARDKGICHICGNIPEKYHFDHVIPISKGGPHSAENIKVACAFCNMSKKDKIAA